MNVVAIIQARSGSVRLPNKVFLPLGAATVLEWVMRRVKQFNFISSVCLATTNDPEDDQIAMRARSEGVACIRHGVKLSDGRNDVLGRFARAVRETKADHVVRITADCPFISPQLAAEVWHRYDFKTYTSNTTKSLDGFDVEILPGDMILRMDKDIGVSDLEARHHVTLSCRKQGIGSWQYVGQPQVWHRKLSLDTEQDYKLMSDIAQHVAMSAEWGGIIAAADAIQEPRRLS